MDLDRKKKAFVSLGTALHRIIDNTDSLTGNDTPSERLRQVIRDAHLHNPWFIQEHVYYAIKSIAESLKAESVDLWLERYPILQEREESLLNIGVVMAGNIPVVGFHDFLCVLISGNRIKAKLSSDDTKLLPAIAELLLEIEPGFTDRIEFTEERLKDFDAIIATGSDNTSRYFEYYFGKYPNIIRRNRNAIAVLNGKESKEQLLALGKDIFMYFGLGCRSVSKLYLPENYDFENLLKVLKEFEYIADNHKYRNNYDYFKSIYMINKVEYFDNEILLLKKDDHIASPVSVVFYEFYDDLERLADKLNAKRDEIQCIVTELTEASFKMERFKPGQSQSPQLWDYADGIDTMEFLLSLDKK